MGSKTGFRKFLSSVLTRKADELKSGSSTEPPLRRSAPELPWTIKRPEPVSGAGLLSSLELVCILWMPLFDK
jgi:hypothetical protein